MKMPLSAWLASPRRGSQAPPLAPRLARRPSVTLLAFMALVLTLAAASPLHAQDDKRASREREALRRSQQALRSAQESQAALQREKASLLADKAKLDTEAQQKTKALDSAVAQNRAARTEQQKLQGELSAAEAALRDTKIEAAAQRSRADALERSLAEARALAAERTAANASVSALLARSTDALANAERKNRELYAIGRKLIDEMRTDAGGLREPFLRLGDVQTENKAEAIRSQMDAQRIVEAPAPTTPAR